MKWLMCALPILAFAGCVFQESGHNFSPERSSSLKSSYPTLMVYNTTGNHVNIYVNGSKAGTAIGTETCIGLRGATNSYQRIRFSSVSWGPVYSEQENFRNRDGWSIRLRGRTEQSLRLDMLTLQPSSRCE